MAEKPLLDLGNPLNDPAAAVVDIKKSGSGDSKSLARRRRAGATVKMVRTKMED